MHLGRVLDLGGGGGGGGTAHIQLYDVTCVGAWVEVKSGVELQGDLGQHRLHLPLKIDGQNQIDFA